MHARSRHAGSRTYHRSDSFSKQNYEQNNRRISYSKAAAYVLLFFGSILLICIAPQALSSEKSGSIKLRTPELPTFKTPGIPKAIHYEDFPDINIHDVHEKAKALFESEKADDGAELEKEREEQILREEEEESKYALEQEILNEKDKGIIINNDNKVINTDNSPQIELTHDELIRNSLAEAQVLIHELNVLKYERHVVMEFDEFAKERIRIAQSAIRKFLTLKYGPGPYYVKMRLSFPDSMMTESASGGLKGSNHEASLREEEIIIELAPIDYVPYSVYMFLEYIVRGYASGSFHRNAGHVLQAMVNVKDENNRNVHERFAWQEYSPHYPHKKYTLGYAGRPSSNGAFYISTMDNVRNHGPASQGSKSEADSIIGRIFSGEEVVQRMCSQPNKGNNGFIKSPNDYIKILSLELIRN